MERQKVKFLVKFQDWNIGDMETFRKARAEKYIGMGLCVPVKPRRKKTAPVPKNKMATGATKK